MLKRLVVVLGGIVSSTVVVAAGVFIGQAGPGGASSGAIATWSERSVPQGVSLKMAGADEVFVRRVGEDVQVFELDVHHLAGERELWWCPAEQLFAAPTHGELFAGTGDVVGGPAQRGLDQLDVERVGTNVRVFDRLIPGHAPADDRRTAPASSGLAWDSGPGSFCAGALRP